VKGTVQDLTPLVDWRPAAAATVLLGVLQNDYARAAVIAEDDPRLATEAATYDAAGTKVGGYLRPPEGRLEAAGGCRDPREPGPQPAHQGRHPPAGRGRVPRPWRGHGAATASSQDKEHEADGSALPSAAGVREHALETVGPSRREPCDATHVE
jgi:hypothetical protein